MRNLISASLVCLLALGTTAASYAKTINVPAQWATIQLAVDHALPGDKISVEEHVVSGPVVVSVQNIDIAGEEGATVDAGGASFGVDVETTGVTVRGLTVKNAGAGIYLAFGGNRVQANTVSACGTGIACTSLGDVISVKTTIDHNSVTGNGIGIDLNACQNTTVTHNIATANALGIFVEVGSIGCTLDHNIANFNTGDGISIDSSSSIGVSHCTADNNGGSGVALTTVTEMCVLDHNEANNNAADGFFIDGLFSTGNILSHNTASGNVPFDAQDLGGSGNVYDHNTFGHTSGI